MFLIIQDKLQSRYVPSVVNYSVKTPGIQIAVGGYAKRKSILSPENTIYDTKRMLAKEYDDENIQKLIPKWPFKIERSKTGKILICLEGIDAKLEPYEVSSEILKYLCEVGNSRLPPDKKTKDVVITIPANFGNDQRLETIRAAEKANLNVLKIINEPTSAGIAYKLLTGYSNIHNVFVFDFGGGTLDVSLLYINDNDIIVKATDGDMFLGGRDFDEKMIEHIISNHKFDDNFINNPIKMAKLRENVIAARIELSGNDDTTIVSEDGDFSDIELTLEQFEDINKDLIDRILIPVERLLEQVEINKDEIDGIILVGGSSNMKFVHRKLTDYFGKEPFRGFQPEEVVALGAGFIAAKLINNDNEELPKSIQSLKVQDICPFSIGTSIINDTMDICIKKNTPIPFSYTDDYFTMHYKQKKISC